MNAVRNLSYNAAAGANINLRELLLNKVSEIEMNPLPELKLVFKANDADKAAKSDAPGSKRNSPIQGL
jgi:hypothetical protein